MINAKHLPRTIGAGPGIPLAQKVMLGLIGLGLVLMPFSTEPGPDSFVIPFGLPFLAIAALLAIPFLITRFLRLKIYQVIILTLAFLRILWIGLTVTTVSSQTIASSARATVEFVGFLVFTYILSSVATNHDGRLMLYGRGLEILTLSGTILALYFLFSFFSAIESYGAIPVLLSRYTGGLMSLPWGASNTIASILIMPLFVAFGLAYFGQGRTRFFFLLSALTMFTAVLVTQSRSGLASILAGIFLVLVIRKTVRPIVGIAGIAIAVLSVGYMYGPDALEIVFDTRLGNIAELSTLNGRLDLWGVALDYYQTRPLDPIGYYSSQYVFGFSPHNLVITTLIEQGLPGLILIIALYFLGILTSLRSAFDPNNPNSGMAAFFLCGLMTLFVDAQFEDAQFTYPFIIYFWFFLALLFLIRYFSPANSRSSP